VLDVGRIAGNQVIHSYNLVTLGQEPVAQVRAQETRTASDENTHLFSPFVVDNGLILIKG
jgi:hypothetical protein